VDASRARGAKLLVLAGEQPDAPDLEDFQQNTVYSYLGNPEIDGIVVASATFTSHHDIDYIQSYIRRLSRKPLVSIGTPMGDAPYVLIENSSGMTSIVDHLIEVHGYSRIAFIRGPVSNPEAQARLEAYKKSLASHGIAFDESLTAVGNFTRPSGTKAMEELLRARGNEIQAVVAANDDMALAAMECVEARGIVVPDKMAFVGFDNIPDSGSSRTPLTTVEQPVRDQAYRATGMLLDLIAGKHVEKSVQLGTKIVVRRSCGCISQTVSRISGSCFTSRAADTQAERADLNKIFEPLFRKSRCPESLIAKLIEAYSKLESDESGNPSLVETTTRAFYDALRGEEIAEGDIAAWNDVVTAFFNAEARRGNANRAADSFLQAARALVGEAIERSKAIELMKMQTLFTNLRRVLQDVISQPDMKGIGCSLVEHLPELGFPSFNLLVYPKTLHLERNEPFVLPEESRLIVTWKAGNNGTERPIPTLQLLPEGFFSDPKSWAIIVRPLNTDNRHYGMITLELGPLNDIAYENLRVQVSRSIEKVQILAKNAAVAADSDAKEKRIEALVKPMLESFTRVSAIADENRQLVDELLKDTKDSEAKIRESSNTIGRIVESMKMMKELISAIDDIAVMINVLAINASIEAARAGDRGKGFGVIAQEVRKLAANTASNTSKLIKAIELNYSNALTAMNVSAQSVSMFQQMADSVHRSAGSLTEIAKRMEELDSSGKGILDTMK
jgi:DNA-binding LacI/PurR family transcriptional regulator